MEEPIAEYGMLNPDGTYTYWDYLKWRFSERVELIRGKLFKMSPAPSVVHQIVSRNLSKAIFTFFENKSCQAFAAPFDVRLPILSERKDTTVVQPDLCVVCDDEKLRDGKGCNGAPDLVVEILSSGNSRHDMETKFNLYEESGVKEYWMVDPRNRTVFVYCLENGRYIGRKPFVDGMEVQSTLFPDLKILVEKVFDKVQPELP